MNFKNGIKCDGCGRFISLKGTILSRSVLIDDTKRSYPFDFVIKHYHPKCYKEGANNK